jgi:predicted dehydrogenase
MMIMMQLLSTLEVIPETIHFVISLDAASGPFNNDAKVRWGVIGLGDVCTVKAGPAFYKAYNSTLTAVMRRTPGMAQSWIDDNIKANKFPNSVAKSIRAYESVEEMLTDVQPDALYVATPPGAHLEVIRKIVAAPSASTLKAVYIEKPCGRCAWETRALIYDTTKHKVLSSIVSLAHERTQMIRELLQSQMIGDRVTKVQYTQRSRFGTVTTPKPIWDSYHPREPADPSQIT